MTNLMRVNMLLEVPDGADMDDVEVFLYDLEWVGGNRDPDNDPMFESVKIISLDIARGRRRKSDDS